MANTDRTFTVEDANGKVITVAISIPEGSEDSDRLVQYINEAINDWLL